MARKKRQPHRFHHVNARLRTSKPPKASRRSTLQRQRKAPSGVSARHPKASVQSALHRHSSLIDIIDRVLDKGIVVEYHARVAIGGIDTLMRIDARYVAASFTTYVRYAGPLRRTGLLGASIGFHALF